MSYWEDIKALVDPLDDVTKDLRKNINKDLPCSGECPEDPTPIDIVCPKCTAIYYCSLVSKALNGVVEEAKEKSTSIERKVSLAEKKVAKYLSKLSEAQNELADAQDELQEYQ